MNYNGQGSLEYLMLIAAAVVVVAIVVSFIAGMVPTVQDAGNKQNYDFLCGTLKTKTFECGCYLCDDSEEYRGVNPANESGGEVLPSGTECGYLVTLRNNPALGSCIFDN